MAKLLINTLYLIACLCLTEITLYSKDYNEVSIINNYVKYEIEKGTVSEIRGDNYEVVKEDGKYVIIYYRKSIFNFKFLKKIKYHVII